MKPNRYLALKTRTSNLLGYSPRKIQNSIKKNLKMPFSEGVSTHETTLQELKDETNLEKKRTVWLCAKVLFVELE